MINALDDVDSSDTFEATEVMVAQDADLTGTIGTITITNKVQQLTVPGGVDADIENNIPSSTSDFYSAIVAATSVGAINGAAYTADASGEWVEVGAANGGAADDYDAHEITVYIA